MTSNVELVASAMEEIDLEYIITNVDYVGRFVREDDKNAIQTFGTYFRVVIGNICLSINFVCPAYLSYFDDNKLSGLIDFAVFEDYIRVLEL